MLDCGVQAISCSYLRSINFVFGGESRSGSNKMTHIIVQYKTWKIQIQTVWDQMEMGPRLYSQFKKYFSRKCRISDLQWRKLSTGMNWLKEQGSRLRLISTLSPASSRTAARFSSSNTCHCRDEQSNKRWSSAESRRERGVKIWHEELQRRNRFKVRREEKRREEKRVKINSQNMNEGLGLMAKSGR